LQPALEILFDLDDQQHPARVDVSLDVLHAMQICYPLEHAGAIETGQQLPRCGAAILVQHRVGNVVEIVGSRVAEDQSLHDRWNQEAHARPPVLENRQQLLARECDDP